MKRKAPTASATPSTSSTAPSTPAPASAPAPTTNSTTAPCWTPTRDQFLEMEAKCAQRCMKWSELVVCIARQDEDEDSEGHGEFCGEPLTVEGCTKYCNTCYVQFLQEDFK